MSGSYGIGLDDGIKSLHVEKDGEITLDVDGHDTPSPCSGQAETIYDHPHHEQDTIK